MESRKATFFSSLKLVSQTIFFSHFYFLSVLNLQRSPHQDYRIKLANSYQFNSALVTQSFLSQFVAVLPQNSIFFSRLSDYKRANF